MKIGGKAIAAMVALAFLSTSCVLSGSALAGFTARVTNSANTIASGTAFLTGTNGTVQCTSVPTGSTVPATSSFPCTGNQFPTTVAATGNTTGAEVLTATGTARFTSASYAASSCGPVQLANTATAADPMLVRSGVTFAGTGPTSLTGSGSFGVDGSTGLAVDVAAATGLQTFSEGIWFKTTVAQGDIMGYSTSSSNVAAGNYDRHIYLNSAGNVVFGTYSGASNTVASTASYINGTWHFALATLTSNTGTSSQSFIQTLYVDGAQVATTTRTVTSGNGAEADTGYWRIGQSRTSTADGWTGNGEYFSGSLSNAMVFPSALSAAQVSGLYASTTQAAFSAAATTAGVRHFWPLNDNGLQTFSGTYPSAATGSACAHIRVTVGTATTCVYPVLATVCAAPSSTSLLSTLVAAGALGSTPPTPTASQTLTTTLVRDTTYNTNYDVGLHLLVPVVVTVSPFTQTFTWATNVVIV